MINLLQHANILRDISLERAKQEKLKSEGRFKYTCADKEMDIQEKGIVLGEEYGEVCRAVLEKRGLANDTHNVDLRKELIQVCAVAVAWIECIDNYGEN